MSLPLLLSYWLKMLLLSAVLLGYYWLFLRKTAAHGFNRYYLLGSVFLALLLPLLRLPLPDWTDPIDHAAASLARPHLPAHRAEVTEEYIRDYFDIRVTLMQHVEYAYIAYGLITLLFLWPLLRSLFVIHTLKRRYPRETVADIYIYSTREPGAPFSFLNHLFWNEAIPTDTPKGQLIFRHELYHIRHLHTLDILTLETFRRLFWCNPFFYLILGEAKQVHEFLADRFALQSAPDTTAPNLHRSEYAEWLVWQSQGIPDTPRLVHSFYHSKLKKRITMILQPTPARAGLLTRWLTIPLALLLLFAFTAKKADHPLTRIPYSDDPVLQNPQLTRFFLHHLRYPEAALQRGMEGIVWFDIIIGPDGRKSGGSAGTGQLDTQNGKVPTLTVNSRPLYPQQRIAEPAATDTAINIFLRELMEVENLVILDPVAGCPPGDYYFSVVFKIEKP
jgi:hypothetical protein